MNRVNAFAAAAAAGLAATWWLARYEGEDAAYTIRDVPLLGDAVGLIDDASGALLNPDLQTMAPSAAVRDMLRRRERLLLTRTNLGDGGWTIGYGRFSRVESALPERITVAEAEAMLDEDIEARAARWVRAYVRVPLSQEQFDALVHMAYNLKPSSFRTIAEAVNRGEGPEAAALRYIRAGTQFERGLRARRADEFALFNQGVYA